jgi:hypothetical protein
MQDNNVIKKISDCISIGGANSAVEETGQAVRKPFFIHGNQSIWRGHSRNERKSSVMSE